MEEGLALFYKQKDLAQAEIKNLQRLKSTALVDAMLEEASVEEVTAIEKKYDKLMYAIYQPDNFTREGNAEVAYIKDFAKITGILKERGLMDITVVEYMELTIKKD